MPFKIVYRYLLISLLLSSGQSFGQSFESVKVKDIQQLVKLSGEKVRIINFWATWCSPCIKEMPYFEKINENKEADVFLISMDYDLDPNPEKVNRFIARKNLKSKVLYVTEGNPKAWFGKIDKSWQGNLPVTLIINPTTGKRKFIQQELQQGDLEKFIQEVIH